MKHSLLAALSLICALSCQKETGSNTPAEYDGTVVESGLVDLGLSVKWASCNLGAASPEADGDFYTWGDTEVAPAATSIATYCFYDSNGRKYTSDYNTAACVLKAENDAAVQKTSGSCRIPTYEEAVELQTKCSWLYAKYKSVTGYVVTASNGNSIFIPAAGYIADEGRVRAGEQGLCWTSTMASKNSNATDMAAYAKSISFMEKGKFVGDSHRYLGCTIRPVSVQ